MSTVCLSCLLGFIAFPGIDGLDVMPALDMTWTEFILDVINVSGHRLSTAEIESALITHAGVAETAGTSAISDFHPP